MESSTKSLLAFGLPRYRTEFSVVETRDHIREREISGNRQRSVETGFDGALLTKAPRLLANVSDRRSAVAIFLFPASSLCPEGR